jgi:hypothetical protein
LLDREEAALIEQGGREGGVACQAVREAEIICCAPLATWFELIRADAAWPVLGVSVERHEEQGVVIRGIGGEEESRRLTECLFDAPLGSAAVVEKDVAARIPWIVLDEAPGKLPSPPRTGPRRRKSTDRIIQAPKCHFQRQLASAPSTS